jgi:hypothetical protein
MRGKRADSIRARSVTDSITGRIYVCNLFRAYQKDGSCNPGRVHICPGIITTVWSASSMRDFLKIFDTFYSNRCGLTSPVNPSEIICDDPRTPPTRLLPLTP